MAGEAILRVPASELSIVHFLTDGSLAGLCDALAQLSQARVRLRDRTGMLVLTGGVERVGGPDVVGGRTDDPAWRLADAAGPAEEARWHRKAITLGEHVLGWIEADLASASDPEALASALRHVSAMAGEVCGHRLEARQVLREVSATYRLAELIAQARGMDDVLQIGLGLAIEALGLDAGSIVLLKEDASSLRADESALEYKSSRGLSQGWLKSPLPLSKDRLFDRLALAGQIVMVEDLLGDDRVLIPDAVQAEGLRSVINAGLIFRDRPLGVLRLYARKPRRLTTADERLARVIGQQLATAVAQAQMLVAQQHERQVQRQLALAADVQRRMLPRRVPTVPGVGVAARWTPSLELAGDFYDFYQRGSEAPTADQLPLRYGLVLGDVVGKGVAAALLMAVVRSSFRAHTRGHRPLAEALGMVNVDLCHDTLESEFVTLWCGELEPATLTLHYASCGHEPALLWRDGSVQRLEQTGLLMGVVGSATFAVRTIQLRPGDVFLAYTDGISEAMNFDGARFGRQRLTEAFVAVNTELPGTHAAVRLDALFAKLRAFTGLAKRSDDQTAILACVL